jgi:hypothetical protein
MPDSYQESKIFLQAALEAAEAIFEDNSQQQNIPPMKQTEVPASSTAVAQYQPKFPQSTHPQPHVNTQTTHQGQRLHSQEAHYSPAARPKLGQGYQPHDPTQNNTEHEEEDNKPINKDARQTHCENNPYFVDLAGQCKSSSATNQSSSSEYMDDEKCTENYRPPSSSSFTPTASSSATPASSSTARSSSSSTQPSASSATNHYSSASPASSSSTPRNSNSMVCPSKDGQRYSVQNIPPDRIINNQNIDKIIIKLLNSNVPIKDTNTKKAILTSCGFTVH